MAKHKMSDLKRTAAESKKGDAEAVFPGSEGKPYYPLSLHVNGPEVEKLGLSGVQVGEEHDLEARVKVTSVSIDESEGSKKRESVTLTLLAGAVYSEHGESDEERGLQGIVRSLSLRREVGHARVPL